MAFKGFESVKHGTYKGIVNTLRQWVTWDGTTATLSTPLGMGSNKITGLAAGTSNGDAVRYEQLTGITPLVDSVSLGASGGTITHTFEAGYDYWLEVDGAVTLTDAVSVYLQANGVSTSSYAHVAMSDTSNSPSVTPSGSNSDTSITLKGTASTLGNGTGESFDATIKIRAPASTAVHKRFVFSGGWADVNGEEAHTYGSGRYKSTDALTSVFIGATGATPHFSAGTMTLYRTARS